MTRTFLQCGILVCALTPVACASEEPPGFLLSLYESGGAGGEADGGVHARPPGQTAGGAGASFGGSTGVAAPEQAGSRAFGQGGRPSSGAAGGATAYAAGGAFGLAGSPGAGGAFGAGGALGGRAEDAGTRTCATSPPESGSACSAGGARCTYGRLVCTCSSGHWLCDD